MIDILECADFLPGEDDPAHTPSDEEQQGAQERWRHLGEAQHRLLEFERGMRIECQTYRLPTLTGGSQG